VADLLTAIIDSLAPPPTFTIQVASNMPTLKAKRLPLEQVFMNLIGNAIKHHDRLDGRVQISANDLGEYYEFVISDDGPGIDPIYHDQIFTIFQTLKARDAKESTGIGLSIVKKIVEGEDGTIELESKIGEGTTFRFTWLKQPETAS
jgi:signal transduction histidine kinase